MGASIAKHDFDGTAVGRAWVKGAWRPIYSQREIRRGKCKGQVEVTIRKSGGYQKRKIFPDQLCKKGRG